MGRHLLSRLAFVLVVLSLASSGTARAQLTGTGGTGSIVTAQTWITVPEPSAITRKNGFRPSTQQLPFWVNQHDCLDGDEYTFPLTLAIPAIQTGYLLQVWVGSGTNCYDLANRSGSAQQCWLVYSKAPNNTIFPVTVPAQAIAAAKKLSDSATAQNVDASGVPRTSDADCNQAATHQAVSLYFMIVSAGGTANLVAQGNQPITVIGYDVSAPAPPSGVSGSSGETRASLHWAQAADTDTYGYEFYCDPTPGTASSALTQSSPLGTLQLALSDASVPSFSFDAGAGGSAGSVLDAGTGGLFGAFFDGGTGVDAGPASCVAGSVVRPGKPPPSGHVCGSVSGIAATNGTVSHLTNGVEYVIGVSAIDQVGNVGVLSNNVCVVPVEVTDFFELYRAAGGGGGGGFCSISRFGGAPPAWLLSMLGTVAVAGAVRRLRRRR